MGFRYGFVESVTVMVHSPNPSSLGTPRFKTPSPTVSVSGSASATTAAGINAFASDSAHFAGRPQSPVLPEPGNEAAKSGWWNSGKAFIDEWRHGTNKEMVHALALKYAPELLVAGAVVLPGPGWLAAGLGFIPATIAAGRGEKRLKALQESGKLKDAKNPIAQSLEIHGNWEKSGSDKMRSGAVNRLAHSAVDTFNGMLKDMFPEKNETAATVRQRLTIEKEGRAFGSVKHLFHANQLYGTSWTGKALRGFSNMVKHVPIRFVKLLFGLPSMAAFALTLLFRHSAIRNAVRLGEKGKERALPL